MSLPLGLHGWPKHILRYGQATFEEQKRRCYELIMLPIAVQYARDQVQKVELKPIKKEKLMSIMVEMGTANPRKTSKGKQESQTRKRPAAAVFKKPAAGAASKKAAAGAASKKAAAEEEEKEDEAEEEEEEEESEEEGEDAEEPNRNAVDKRMFASRAWGNDCSTPWHHLQYIRSLCVLLISMHAASMLRRLGWAAYMIIHIALQETDAESFMFGDPSQSFMEAAGM